MSEYECGRGHRCKPDDRICPKCGSPVKFADERYDVPFDFYDDLAVGFEEEERDEE